MMTVIVVALEIERCIADIEAAISREARRPADLYRDLLLELRYQAQPFQLNFSTPAAMIAFVEELRAAPSLEIAVGHWTRQACVDYLRRVRDRRDEGGSRFYKPQAITLLESMIAAVETLTDMQPEPTLVDHTA